MKFECKGNTLTTSIVSVAKARSKQNNQSYLQDIYIELENHLLTLRATNLEISCEKSVSVKGIHNGKCIVKGDTLLKVIQALQNNEETLTCELFDGVFSIKQKNGIIELKTTPFEDFPTLPNQGELLGKLPNTLLLSLIRDVSFCAATTEIKPEIASVYIYTLDKNIVSVATDSYRLAERVVPSPNQIKLNILIPQKHLSDIIAILSEEKGDINMYQKEGILTCVSEEGLTLCIHTITGQFPDYRQLFPKTFTATSLIQREDLQKTLTLATYFTENYSQIKCVFANNTLTVHSRNEAIGQITNTIPTTQTGEDVEVNYNNRYFLETLSHIKGKEVEFSFTTPNRPLFIKNKEDTLFTQLLMPLTK